MIYLPPTSSVIGAHICSADLLTREATAILDSHKTLHSPLESDGWEQQRGICVPKKHLSHKTYVQKTDMYSSTGHTIKTQK